MNKTTRILLPVALLGVFAAGAVFAKPAGKADQAAPSAVASLDAFENAPRLRLGLRRAIRQLEITPEQIAAGKVILKAHHAEISAAFDVVATAREELRRAIRTSPVDNAALAIAADEVGAAERDLVFATATLRADLRLILTDAQRIKLEGHEVRFHERISEVREMVEAWIEAT